MIDDIFAFYFVLLFAILLAGLISVPTLLSYFLYKYLNKKGFKKIGLFLLIIAPIWTGYGVYTAVYPTDSFYFDEFKEVTQMKVPGSAIIIRKSASYPDLQGDYCSASLIKLSEQDYIDLFKKISENKSFTKDEKSTGSDEFVEVMGDIKESQINFNFSNNTSSHYGTLYIGFIDNQKYVIAHLCNF